MITKRKKPTMFADVLRANAARLAAKPAFLFGEKSFTFADINSRTNRFANALTALGLSAGERVAILSRNRPEYFEVIGAAKGGFITIPLNWRLSTQELLHPFSDSEPTVVVCEPAFADLIDQLRPRLPSVRHFILFGSGGPAWISYEALLSSADDSEPQSEIQPDDPLCLIYTSGTTGKPKGAVLTHYGVWANAQANADGLLTLSIDDVGLAVMPLFHIGGLWYHLFAGYVAGNTTVILPEFDAVAVTRAIRDYGVTHVHLVPTMISMLLDQPNIADMDLGRLRTIFYAGSSIPIGVLKRSLAQFRNCGFVQSFGSTEAGSVTGLLPGDHLRALEAPDCENLLGSCGRPLGDARVEVHGLDRTPVPVGEIGEIAIRSDRTMREYWRNPAATAETIVDGWLYSGDLGRLDAEGYLYIVDRKHDMIVTGAENVYPREVEDALLSNPAIAEVAVFGLPDSKWVERVAAAIVLKPGSAAAPEDIKRDAADRLAAYKCPKTVIVVESLPRNGAGKVLKRELRRQFADPNFAVGGTPAG